MYESIVAGRLYLVITPGFNFFSITNNLIYQYF